MCAGSDGRTLGGDLALTVDPAGPARLALEAPRPDPAPGHTTLAFALPAAMRASLAVHDVSGRRLRALPAGLHLVRLVTPGSARVRRVALLP